MFLWSISCDVLLMFKLEKPFFFHLQLEHDQIPQLLFFLTLPKLLPTENCPLDINYDIPYYNFRLLDRIDINWFLMNLVFLELTKTTNQSLRVLMHSRQNVIQFPEHEIGHIKVCMAVDSQPITTYYNTEEACQSCRPKDKLPIDQVGPKGKQMEDIFDTCSYPHANL